MSEWLAMGGHGFYVWMSYGMAALAVALELVSLRMRRHAVHERITQLGLDAQ